MTYTFDKKRISKLILNAGIFMLLAVYAIVSGSQFMKIMGFIGLLFFGYGFYYFIIQLFSSKTVLEINSTGIVDSVSGYGNITWDQVEDVQIDGNMSVEEFINNIGKVVMPKPNKISSTYLLITLKDRDTFFDNLSGLKKTSLKLNSDKFFGGKIEIQLNNLNVRPQDVLIEIAKFWKK